jgi:hypothetical protein
MGEMETAFRNASQIERNPRPSANDHVRRGSAIAKNVFTTEALAPSRQFDAYREYCAPVIEISPAPRSTSSFAASCEMWQLGCFAFRRIRTPAGRFERRDAQVRRDGLDHWVFNVVRHGKQHTRTASSELGTAAGELSVFSLAAAYQACRTDVDWLGLFVPRGIYPVIDASLNYNQHHALDNSLGVSS